MEMRVDFQVDGQIAEGGVSFILYLCKFMVHYVRESELNRWCVKAMNLRRTIETLKGRCTGYEQANELLEMERKRTLKNEINVKRIKMITQ